MSDTERRPDTGHTPDRPDTGHTPDRPDTGHTPDRPDTGHTPAAGIGTTAAVPATETLTTGEPSTRTGYAEPPRPWRDEPDTTWQEEPRRPDAGTDRRRPGVTGEVWSAATAPPVQPPSGPRTGTVVLGLVLALSGIVALVVGLGFTIDLQLAFIGLLVLAAVALLTVPLLQRRRARGAREGS